MLTQEELSEVYLDLSGAYMRSKKIKEASEAIKVIVHNKEIFLYSLTSPNSKYAVFYFSFCTRNT